jgi:hypothetical protein
MTDEKKLLFVGPLKATFLYDILPQELLLPHPLLRFYAATGALPKDSFLY